MRIFTTSDLHVDYKKNLEFIKQISDLDYQNDILILAGDLTHKENLLCETLVTLKKKFAELFFLPGNHDLWLKEKHYSNSIEKFETIMVFCQSNGIQTAPRRYDDVEILPLYSWYDHSFGEPNADLRKRWGDYKFCEWPKGMSLIDVNQYFINLNDKTLQDYKNKSENKVRITFSHFMPRVDILPIFTGRKRYWLAPVMGCESLEAVVRALMPQIHIYGHSHIHVDKIKKGILYKNHALAYPSEQRYQESVGLYEIDKGSMKNR